MPLSVYTAFPAGGSSVTPSQLSEIFLKAYTISSGVAGINISDPLFKLADYKTIHIRINNLNSTTTSGYIGGGPYKNDALVTGGTYRYTFDGISSATATGWGTSTGSPINITTIYGYVQLTPAGLDFSSGIGQIDIYLTRQGMTFEMHNPDSTASRRLRATVVYPVMQTNPAATDYFGLNIGLSSGTFTGGTVNVYGVQ